MTATLDAPRAGLIDDMTDDDDRRGYERDETDTAFRQLVDQLADDGCRTAGAEGDAVTGGFFTTPQPVLLLTGPLAYRAADDACPLCGYWRCHCGDAVQSQSALPVRQNTQQCDQCGGWFGFTPGSLWTCDACQAIGR